MPLAPPVTTTTLPATCIVSLRFLECLWNIFWNISGQNEIEHGGIVASRAQQHKTMPDRVLEAQPLPRVKDHPETIEQATGGNQPQRQMRERRQAGIIGNQPAPAH